jgi:hypothetical protein
VYSKRLEKIYQRVNDGSDCLSGRSSTHMAPAGREFADGHSWFLTFPSLHDHDVEDRMLSAIMRG